MKASVGAELRQRRRAPSVDRDDGRQTPGREVVERVGERLVGRPRGDAERIEENRSAVGVGAVGDAEADFASCELMKVGDVARGDDFDRFAVELGDVRRPFAPRCARLRVGDERVERRDGEIGAVAFDGCAERGGRTPPATILPPAPPACIAAMKSPASRLVQASLGSASKAKLAGAGFGGVGAATLWLWSLAPGV